MINVAFDTFVLSARFRNHGSYEYARRLLQGFTKLAAANDRIAIKVFLGRTETNDAANLITPGCRVELVADRLLAHRRVWRLGGIALAALRADILFCPVPMFVAPHATPTVTTIHDCAESVSPSRAFVKNRLERMIVWNAAAFSRHIVTISESSRRDLSNTYQISPERISVVYNGYDHEIFNATPADPVDLRALKDRFGVKDAYLFHHGTLQPRKNLVRLIAACRLLMERRRSLEFDLVLAGPLGWEAEEILAEVDRHLPRGRIIVTGPLLAREVAVFVKGACLCVIPSLYEGFCLPMVECLASGAPTVVSNTSCFPEVSGGVLPSFDPTSLEDIASTICKVLDDSDLRSSLCRAGLNRAKQFSWGRCAQQTFDLLMSAAHDDGVMDYLPV